MESNPCQREYQRFQRRKFPLREKGDVAFLRGKPDVYLSDAWLWRNEARLLLAEGLDPSVARKEEKFWWETTELVAGKNKQSVRAVIDGTSEIWKGHPFLG